MKKVEILAPAGDWDSLRTAIYNGADAVYLGMQNFNARAKATNFTAENIREATRLAHLFGVKIYLTVNTLLNNSEMPDLIATIKSAVQAKVDAYIVQDFGVLALLKHHFPNITLHASTQMGIHNLYGAEMAEKMGVTRIVLSRETKLEDIVNIKKHTGLELEFFVQGALCVAFSGNCYLSAMEKGESGNRGRCLQLCRLPYSANTGKVAGQSKYLLSPADLCLLSGIKKLTDAGVCCFKIEGRLRRAGYVGQAVSSYRKAVDMLAEKGNLSEDFIRAETFNLKKVFSRGEFNTDAYLSEGVPDKTINFNTQNHTGIRIGKVLEVKPFKERIKQVIIYSEKPLKQYDGLKFFENETEVGSLGVGNVDNLSGNKYRIYTSQFIRPDWDVNLIVDYEAEKSFTDTVKTVPVRITAEAKENSPLTITAEAGGTEAVCRSDFICEKAKNAPTAPEQIAEQIGKFGGTLFSAEKVEVRSENVFIPKSVLNEARRQVLQLLEEKIIQENEKHLTVGYNPEPLTFNAEKKVNYSKILVFSQPEHVAGWDSRSADTLFVYAPAKYREQDVESMQTTFKNFGLNLPVVANGKDLNILDKIINSNPSLVLLANNLYGLHYARTNTVIAGTGMNVYNNTTEQELLKNGASACVLSFEQKPENFSADENTFVYAEGTPALMTFCHCPYKTVSGNRCAECSFDVGLKYTGQSGKTFSIRRTQLSQCYFELLSPKKIKHNGYPREFIDLR